MTFRSWTDYTNLKYMELNWLYEIELTAKLNWLRETELTLRNKGILKTELAFWNRSDFTKSWNPEKKCSVKRVCLTFFIPLLLIFLFLPSSLWVSSSSLSSFSSPFSFSVSIIVLLNFVLIVQRRYNFLGYHHLRYYYYCYCCGYYYHHWYQHSYY